LVRITFYVTHFLKIIIINITDFSDNLSDRMLNPEMLPEAEKDLYIDIQNMYTVYLDPDGSEYLYLPLHISKGIRQSK